MRGHGNRIGFVEKAKYAILCQSARLCVRQQKEQILQLLPEMVKNFNKSGKKESMESPQTGAAMVLS
jgi:hypothetical protein